MNKLTIKLLLSMEAQTTIFGTSVSPYTLTVEFHNNTPSPITIVNVKISVIHFFIFSKTFDYSVPQFKITNSYRYNLDLSSLASRHGRTKKFKIIATDSKGNTYKSSSLALGTFKQN